MKQSIIKYAWVYIQTEPNCFTVGFYDPIGEWHADSDHKTRDAAASRVSFLNGNPVAENVK